MNVHISSEKDIVNSVYMECSISEYLIICDALKQFNNNKSNHPNDLVLSQAMLKDIPCEMYTVIKN